MKLTDDQVKRIEQVTEKAIEAEIEAIPKTVHAIVEKSILHVFGMRPGWGGEYEIDFSKKSIIADIVQKRSLEMCGAAIEPIIDAAINRVRTNKNFLHGIVKSAAMKFRDDLKYRVDDETGRQATATAKTLVGALNDIDILPINTDLEDPASCSTKLRELIVEEMLNLHQDGLCVPGTTV